MSCVTAAGTLTIRTKGSTCSLTASGWTTNCNKMNFVNNTRKTEPPASSHIVGSINSIDGSTN